MSNENLQALALDVAEQVIGDNPPRGCVALIEAALVAAVEAEREACAKICDGFASGHHFAGDMAGEKSFRRCMDAIRARGTR